MPTVHDVRRFTLVAPLVTNANRASNYPNAVRAALLAAGIDGWTEYATRGAWRGNIEPGITFEIFSSSRRARSFAERLARIGRDAMPDQEAIQVTLDTSPTLLLEG